MNIPDEIFEEWQNGLDSGKNNKTARRDAVLKWNEQNPDNQLTPGEVGVVCRVGDSTDDAGSDDQSTPPPPKIDPNDPPDLGDRNPPDLGEMTKNEIKVWAKEELGIDTPKMNKVDLVKFVLDAWAEKIVSDAE